MVRKTPGITVLELLVYFILEVIKFQIHNNKLFRRVEGKKLFLRKGAKNFTKPHWSSGCNRVSYSHKTRIFIHQHQQQGLVKNRTMFIGCGNPPNPV